MRLDHSPAGSRRCGPRAVSLALAFFGAFCGCAGPAQPERAASVSSPVATPAATPQAPAVASASAPSTGPGDPVEATLGYADRIRGLQPPELAQEIGRLGDGGESPAQLLQLAMALAQSKMPNNSLRAQALLQRVLGQNEPEARLLHSLARLFATQLADTRRAEEQVERQTQQLRDAQRRIDQLNDRLEALRAIERSLPSRPASSASAPSHARH